MHYQREGQAAPLLHPTPREADRRDPPISTTMLERHPKPRRNPYPSEIWLYLSQGGRRGETMHPYSFDILFYIWPEEAEPKTSMRELYYANYSDTGSPWAVRMFGRKDGRAVTPEWITASMDDLVYYVGPELAAELAVYMTDLLSAYETDGTHQMWLRFSDMSLFIPFLLDMHQRFASELGVAFDREAELEDLRVFWTDTSEPYGGQAQLAWYRDPDSTPHEDQTAEGFAADRASFEQLVADWEQALAAQSS